MELKNIFKSVALAALVCGFAQEAKATHLVGEISGTATMTFNPTHPTLNMFEVRTNLAGGRADFDTNGAYSFNVNYAAGASSLGAAAASQQVRAGTISSLHGSLGGLGYWGTDPNGNSNNPNGNTVHLFNTVVAIQNSLNGLPAGTLPQVGYVIDQDLSPRSAGANEGYHASYLTPDGSGSGILVQSAGCPSLAGGCVGDVFPTGNPYFSLTYAGLQSFQSGANLLTYAYFNMAGTGSQVNSGGVRIVDFRLDPSAQVRFLVRTQTPNGGTAVPEPATMGLLAGSLALGAYRKRKANNS